MWAHYSSNHTGVILIFDTEKDTLFSKANKVKYVMSRPSITVDNISEVLYQKAKPWNYEMEYRILMKTGNTCYQFNEQALVGIILGMHMKEKISEEIFNITRLDRKIQLYKAEPSSSKYVIDYKQINPLNI